MLKSRKRKKCPPGCVKKPIRKASRKRRSMKRKASRKMSRKRRSVKRKASRKRRSVKRKASRKRRSVKRKASRKMSRKRKSAKKKASRKRKSAKKKASRKRKSAKKKASRKRKSAKKKASRKRKSAKKKASRKRGEEVRSQLLREGRHARAREKRRIMQKSISALTPGQLTRRFPGGLGYRKKQLYFYKDGKKVVRPYTVLIDRRPVKMEEIKTPTRCMLKPRLLEKNKVPYEPCDVLNEKKVFVVNREIPNAADEHEFKKLFG